MPTAVLSPSQVSSQWRMARRIYPVYSAILRQFELGIEPCRELESPINRSEPEVMQRIHDWFLRMDEKIEAYQLRQLLQTSHLGTEDILDVLIRRNLAATKKTKNVRDKVDFLVVQYYAQCSPHGSHENPDFDHFADVLYPILGDASQKLPPFCSGFEDMLKELGACTSLGDLLQKQIIDKARTLKDQAGEKYFLPSVLVAVARFNYLMRLGFFRLMHADLHAIRFVLHEMEGRGQTVCDCSSAGLSRVEPLSNLRQLCHQWKTPFRAAYSAGNNFQTLVKIRAAVEVALAAPPPAPIVETMPPTKVADKPTPQAEAPQAPPVVDANGIPSLEDCIVLLSEQVKVSTPKATPVNNVVLRETRLLLASWEVAAFARGRDAIAETLKRAVASRAILSLSLDRKKRGEAIDLTASLAEAHEEAAKIQARIAEAKDAKNIDAAVNLSASAKRLLALMDEIERLK